MVLLLLFRFRAIEVRRAAQKQLDMELTMAGSSGAEAGGGGHLANGGHHLLDLYGDTGPGGRDHGEDR